MHWRALSNASGIVKICWRNTGSADCARYTFYTRFDAACANIIEGVGIILGRAIGFASHCLRYIISIG